ncbi:MAG: threonine/serine exporter family protein [Clostridia bacterium]|nr:threonine/serine exporter family protein [Clostridia bacterium]
MDFKQGLIIVITGMLGTVGFSLLFKAPKRRILLNAVGGMLTSLVYVLCCMNFEHEFMQNFFPALVATVYAEVMARVVKAPATPILACSIIPLVPGGKLYYTTYYFVISEMEMFNSTLTELLRIASGLAVGIICISVVVHEINRHKFKQIIDVE